MTNVSFVLRISLLGRLTTLVTSLCELQLGITSKRVYGSVHIENLISCTVRVCDCQAVTAATATK